MHGPHRATAAAPIGYPGAATRTNSSQHSRRPTGDVERGARLCGRTHGHRRESGWRPAASLVRVSRRRPGRDASAMLRVTTAARAIRTPRGGTLFRVQWGSRILYDWLLAGGLMPAKSRKLGQLAVPEEYFADFFRGCIDGDGSMLVVHGPTPATKKPTYVYERLYVSLVSASLPFVEWIQTTISPAHRGCAERPSKLERGPPTDMDASLRQGRVHPAAAAGSTHPPGAPCLARKRAKAEQFLTRSEQVPWGVGRPGSDGYTMSTRLHPDCSRIVPVWRNGRLAALKTPCPQGRAGSTPAPGTIP